MKGTAHRWAGSEDELRVLRLHQRKYRIGAAERQRIANALETLDVCKEGVELALEEAGANTAVYVTKRMVDALRLLAYGPKGESR